MALPDFIANKRVPLVPSMTYAAPAVGVKQKLLDICVPYRDNTLWCWTAVAYGIAEAYGDSPPEQCEIATKVLDCNCCPYDAGLCNMVCAMEDPLKLFDHYTSTYTGPAYRTYAFVKSEIEDGHPIVVRIEFGTPQDPEGHFLVVSGYCDIGKKQSVCVCDPAYGERFQVEYSELLTNYDGGGYWERTLPTNGDAPVPERPVQPGDCCDDTNCP